MKASSKQNHLWLITSKYRRDRTYCDALVAYLAKWAAMPTMNYSCLYFKIFETCRVLGNLVTILFQKFSYKWTTYENFPHNITKRVRTSTKWDRERWRNLRLLWALGIDRASRSLATNRLILLSFTQIAPLLHVWSWFNISVRRNFVLLIKRC